MSEWIVKTIGEICDLGNGKVQTGPFGSQLHQSDYQEEGYPFVMPKDIINGKIDESSIARVSINHVERLSKHKLSLGDIIYGRRGDIGRQALVRQENVGWLCGSGCLRISLGNAPIDSTFLHLYLQLPEVMSWVENQAIGATMPNLNTTILRSVPVRYPESVYHQQQIVAIVSTYDDLIENNDRRIALLEKMAEEIYREWFVRLRFPGWEAIEFHKGIPEGWKLVKVAEAFEMTGGGTPSKEENRYWIDGDVNWYTPSDITSANGMFLSTSRLRCTQEGLNNSSAKLFPAYSIMMTSRATIGAIGINTTPACTNQGFISCIPNKNYPLTFFYYWLKLNKDHFELLSTGSTFSELSKATFKKMSILTPTEWLVEKFNEKVLPLFQTIEILLDNVLVIKQTRDRLLTRLISGKLSVTDLNIQFPPGMVEP